MGRRVVMVELDQPIQLPVPFGCTRILREGEGISIEEDGTRFLLRVEGRTFGYSQTHARCWEYAPERAKK